MSLENITWYFGSFSYEYNINMVSIMANEMEEHNVTQYRMLKFKNYTTFSKFS
jgi:hypothetical protein